MLPIKDLDQAILYQSLKDLTLLIQLWTWRENWNKKTTKTKKSMISSLQQKLNIYGNMSYLCANNNLITKKLKILDKMSSWMKKIIKSCVNKHLKMTCLLKYKSKSKLLNWMMILIALNSWKLLEIRNNFFFFLCSIINLNFY